MYTIAVAVDTGLTDARKGTAMKSKKIKDVVVELTGSDKMILESKYSTLGIYSRVDVNQLGYCNAFIRKCYLRDIKGFNRGL